MPRSLTAFCCLIAFCWLFVQPVQADPVYEFIVEADSLARTDEDLLGDLVERQAILVGAAVGQLLDVAFQIRADDAAAAAENVTLARTIAGLHHARGGTDVPGTLIDTYVGWTDEQLATKARAAALEAQAAEARGAGDPERDAALLEQAEETYASIGDRRAVAINRGTQGVAHWYAGDWAAVQAAYERALEARRAIEDRILEGRTLNGLGTASRQQGRLEDALTWYHRAIALRERTGDAVGLATSLNYAAQCEQMLGRIGRARTLLERALPILDASGDDRRRIEALHAVGGLYRTMFRLDRAVDAFERALSMIEAAPEYEAGIRLDLAGALREKGRVRDAVDQVRRAEELADGQGDVFFENQLASERGLAFLALGELDRATGELERARELAIETGISEFVAQSELNLANALTETGQIDRALELALHASGAAREADSPRFEILGAQVAVDALDILGRHEEALELANSTIERHSEAEPTLVAVLRSSRGNVLKELGRLKAAREEFQVVRHDLVRTGRRDSEWIPLIGIGDSFESLAPDSASVYYEKAFASLERHRAAAASGAVQTGFLSDQKGKVYLDVTHFYAQQSRRWDRDRWSALAFRTAERARARGLLELVTQSMEAEEDPEIAVLLDELYALEDDDESTLEKRQRVQDEISRRFDAELAVTAPWAGDASAIVGPSELGETLDEDTMALVYAVGEEASYVWAIDGDGHELKELVGRAGLQERVVALREALLTPGYGDRALGSEAHALYKELIEPVASRLRGKDRLWIIPDGVLFEIPFEVLLSEDPGDRPDWQSADYLARDRRIGYAPSANLLVALREEAATQNDAVLALGDPDFSGLSLRAGTTEELPPLPQSRAEVETLVRLRDDTVTLLGADATEGHLRAALQDRHPSIVHLATHGLVDREDPSLTSVALAADSDNAEDGYLYTLEILALPLDAQLVVLSACDTGRGKLERGEGTVGLTRSFLAAGAKRVVASLWPVADASTSLLMQSFYEELLDRGHDPDDALARAREELWKKRETAHPYYWAPFVLMGSDAPLPADVRG